VYNLGTCSRQTARSRLRRRTDAWLVFRCSPQWWLQAWLRSRRRAPCRGWSRFRPARFLL